MSETDYKQRLAFDMAWKAGIGALIAALLSLHVAFQALFVMSVGSFVCMAYQRHREEIREMAGLPVTESEAQ